MLSLIWLHTGSIVYIQVFYKKLDLAQLFTVNDFEMPLTKDKNMLYWYF